MNQFWNEMDRIYAKFPLDPYSVIIRNKKIAEEIVKIAEEENTSLIKILEGLYHFLNLNSIKMLGKYFYLKPLDKNKPLSELAIDSVFMRRLLMLFSTNNLSLAEIRGAIYEAILMIINKPLHTSIKKE